MADRQPRYESIRWRPGGRGERNVRGSPVALRLRLSTDLLWAAVVVSLGGQRCRPRLELNSADWVVA